MSSFFQININKKLSLHPREPTKLEDFVNQISSLSSPEKRAFFSTSPEKMKPSDDSGIFSPNLPIKVLDFKNLSRPVTCRKSSIPNLSPVIPNICKESSKSISPCMTSLPKKPKLEIVGKASNPPPSLMCHYCNITFTNGEVFLAHLKEFIDHPLHKNKSINTRIQHEISHNPSSVRGYQRLKHANSNTVIRSNVTQECNVKSFTIRSVPAAPLTQINASALPTLDQNHAYQSPNTLPVPFRKVNHIYLGNKQPLNASLLKPTKNLALSPNIRPTHVTSDVIDLTESEPVKSISPRPDANTTVINLRSDRERLKRTPTTRSPIGLKPGSRIAVNVRNFNLKSATAHSNSIPGAPISPAQKITCPTYKRNVIDKSIKDNFSKCSAKNSKVASLPRTSLGRNFKKVEEKENRKEICEECMEVFDNFTSLAKHKYLAHGEQQYKFLRSDIIVKSLINVMFDSIVYLLFFNPFPSLDLSPSSNTQQSTPTTQHELERPSSSTSGLKIISTDDEEEEKSNEPPSEPQNDQNKEDEKTDLSATLANILQHFTKITNDERNNKQKERIEMTDKELIADEDILGKATGENSQKATCQDEGAKEGQQPSEVICIDISDDD